MIQKFRKKPVVIEAVKFTDETKDSVFSWAREIQMNIYPSRQEDGSPCLLIPTLEGEMICSLGDYLIKEPFPTDWRRLYPCKPDIFEKTYEPMAQNTTKEPVIDNLRDKFFKELDPLEWMPKEYANTVFEWFKPYLKSNGEPVIDGVPKDEYELAKHFWEQGKKLNSVKIVNKYFSRLVDSKAFCEKHFDATKIEKSNSEPVIDWEGIEGRFYDAFIHRDRNA